MTELDTLIATGEDPPVVNPGVTVPPSNPGQVPGTFVGLPAGVHPLDNSVPITDPWPPSETPISTTEPPTSAPTRPAPWSIENEEALAVYQRAAQGGAVRQITLSATNPVVQAVGRLKGRVQVTLWVDSGATFGVAWGFNEGDVQQGVGVPLNVGDSVTLPCEAAVWIGLQSGQTTGRVNVLDLYNPPGGGLGLSAS